MEKQIEEMAKVIHDSDIADINTFPISMSECLARHGARRTGAAMALFKADYRKQSEDLVDIATVKKWLYQIAINNVGCVIEGDFSNACEEIISRLDGLKRFAEETKGD